MSLESREPWHFLFVLVLQVLFDDDEVANSLESLAGTLKAAKKRGRVAYGPELLLQVGRGREGEGVEEVQEAEGEGG